MNRDQFILTLFSNVNGNNNSLSRFTTTLPQAIRLEGNWSVGLLEISYTKSWYNVNKDCQISVFDSNADSAPSNTMLRAAMYETDVDLVNAINAEINSAVDAYLFQRNENRRHHRKEDKEIKEIKVKEKPKLELNKFARIATLRSGITEELHKRFLFAELPTELEQMLGFNHNENLYRVRDGRLSKDVSVITIKKKVIKGHADAMSAYDLNAGIHNILVYCPLIEPQIVGDSYGPLLRNVQIPIKRFGEQTGSTYVRPDYFPLITNNFQQIEIILKDDSGSLIPFKFGRTTVRLHFKNDSAT